MANILREAVKRYFYPFAESQGFVRAKSTHSQFTTFRRTRGETIQVFDIQWDKYGRPAFVINFGEAQIGASHESGPDIEPQQCTVLCRLQPAGQRSGWWCLKKPWLEVLKSGRFRYEPMEVVDQAISSFSEAETWWADKTEGRCVLILWRKHPARASVAE